MFNTAIFTTTLKYPLPFKSLMLKGILFDVDGVLVDSELLQYLSVFRAYRQYNIIVTLDDYIERWIIKQTCGKGLLADIGKPELYPQISSLRTSIASASVEDMSLMPGAMELIQRFQYLYPAMGVVSSDHKEVHEAKLKRFYHNGAALYNFFPAHITSGDVKEKKPKPEPYSKAVSLLRLQPQDALAIEDSPSGVESAKSAGCKVVYVPNELVRRRNIAVNADAVVDSLHQVNDALVARLFYDRIEGFLS